MLSQSKLIAFVGTKSPAASLQYYRDVLGLQLVADEQSAIVFDANGTMLRISKVPAFDTAPFTVLGWDVPDIEAKVAELISRGGQVERFEGMGQNEQGVLTFPDQTRVAWFKDPDGNMLSFTQFAD
jgi:catechol 2,3-dioxygenase-like lactoylglutathione lyase family enzyme